MVIDAALREELLERSGRDQAARWAASRGETSFEPVAAIDADNTTWLVSVLDERGWPDQTVVGVDGADAAWLLAQHADADPAFQRRCLDHLTDAVARGAARIRHLAYLTDRVLLKEEGHQLYGTQCTTVEGRYVPDRLVDADTVDERRQAVGLGPLADYVASMLDKYGPPRPPTTSCPACQGPVEITRFDEPTVCASCGNTMTFRRESRTGHEPRGGQDR